MSPKYPSPLLGYNHNVRHNGKDFHVQTEDSGVKYGHIITHLFMDGGRILKSVKTSYTEFIGGEKLGDVIREMMKQQHKAMIIALRDGKFDPVGEASADASQRAKVVAAAESPPQAAVVAKDAAPTTDELTLDIGALERAAAAANAASPVLRATSELPPPPANIFRALPPPLPGVPPPLPRVATGPIPARRTSQAAMAATRGGERRYAPTRPASIFGQARPQQGKTIFGEDLISDKSLDEVILSYLAEDVDANKK